MSVSHWLIATLCLALQLSHIVNCNVLGVSQEKNQIFLDAVQLMGWIVHDLVVSITSWYIHGPLLSKPIYHIPLVVSIPSHSLIFPFLNFILSTMTVTPPGDHHPKSLTFYLCFPYSGWGNGVFQQVNNFWGFCRYSHLATQWLVPQPVLVGYKARMWKNSLFNGIVRGTLSPLEIIHFLLKYTLLLPFNIIQGVF